MYHCATSYLFSYLRFLVFCIALLLGAVKMGYGQRVYANRDVINAEYSPGLGGIALGVSGVEYRSRAVDNDFANFSQLQLVALGGSVAWQSLRFPAGTLPSPNSPIYIKFTPPPAVLSLLGGISIVRTNGDNATPVGQAYSDSQLLDLLGLLTPDQPVVFATPYPENPVGFDGIRFSIGGLLSAGSIGRLFFAFFIATPQLESSSTTICEGAAATITLSHFETGYKYKVYLTETGGTSIAETASSSQLSLPISDMSGTYWVEAVDSDVYVSARVPFIVTVLPHPGKPNLSITRNE